MQHADYEAKAAQRSRFQSQNEEQDGNPLMGKIAVLLQQIREQMGSQLSQEISAA